MENPLVLSEKADQIGYVTLNHPEKRNALSRAMLQFLRQELDRLGEADDLRAVILRARGPVFSAGHDLRELVGVEEAAVASLFSLCTKVMEKIRTLRQPVIAQVQGLATAAGCQLVASCDLVVAAETASFATPGVKIGLFCTTPAVAVARAVMPKKALEMLLTGEALSAAEAERAGLVNRVVAPDRLEQETLRLAQSISRTCPEIIALGKAAFYRQQWLDFSEAYRYAEGVMVDNSQLDAAQEGMRAFLEKRAPAWAR